MVSYRVTIFDVGLNYGLSKEIRGSLISLHWLFQETGYCLTEVVIIIHFNCQIQSFLSDHQIRYISPVLNCTADT